MNNQEDYKQQIDVGTPLDTEPVSNNVTPEKPPKLTGWNKFRAGVIMFSVCLAVGCLISSMFFIGPFTKLDLNIAIPTAVTATYINPIIFQTFCKGGTWVAYIGVIYNSNEPNFGYITFYPFTICDTTLAKLQSRIQTYLPNQTLTVWFYPDVHPQTYTYNPYVPVSSDPIYIIFIILMVFIAQVFLVIPINLILIKCFKFKPIGSYICCGGCSKWM